MNLRIILFLLLTVALLLLSEEADAKKNKENSKAKGRHGQPHNNHHQRKSRMMIHGKWKRDTETRSAKPEKDANPLIDPVVAEQYLEDPENENMETSATFWSWWPSSSGSWGGSRYYRRTPYKVVRRKQWYSAGYRR